MSTEKNTSWRKNLDSKFISGEDLKVSFNGLKPEMVVSIEKFNDDETFDQNQSKNVVISALYLKEVGGKSLYKPVILNKTNARFFEKETGTDQMAEWIGVPAIMYAEKHARHGHVVRFKRYIIPELKEGTEAFTKCKLAIEKNGYTIDQIRQKYKVSSDVEQKLLAK